MIWFGRVWYVMVWYSMVWYCLIGIVWFGMVWFGLVWYGMVFVHYEMKRCGIVCYNLVTLVWYGFVQYEEGGDTLSLQRDQLYGPSLLLSIVAIILLTMIQIGVDRSDEERTFKAFFWIEWKIPESPM